VPVSEAAIERPGTPPFAKSANVFAKGALVLMLVFAVLYPDQANLRDKAAGARAIGYPLISFTVPLLWLTMWKFELTSKNATMKLKRLRRRLEAEPAAGSPQPAEEAVLAP